MRKTLSAMVGLLALGVWALPALAGDYDLPKVSEPAPMTNRTGRIGAMARGDEGSYKASLSGTLIKQAQVTSTWFLYPGACQDRQNGTPPGPGTWVAKSAIVADSLDSYDPATQNQAYGVLDGSLKERLWHITDGSDSPDIGAGLVIAGSRSLWCGKYDANWIVKSGYPNLTFQILYIDTDVIALGGGAARSGPYTLSWQENSSTEFNYDYLYLIGGGDGSVDRDPIGNSRARLDRIVTSGFDGNAEMLIIQTGSQIADQGLSYVSHGQTVNGAGSGQPATTTWSLSGIPAQHRGLYLLFTADCLYSGEDGLWPEGHGARLDNVSASDQGAAPNLYSEQTTAGGVDPSDGDILVSVAGNYAISARVAPGVGTVWTIQAGNNLPSGDYCSPQKQRTVDKMFLGADATSKLTLANEYASVVTCTFGIPDQTASVLAVWGEYLDLPGQSGMVQNANFRVFTHPAGHPVTDGTWGNWTDTSAGVRTGALQAWTTDGDEVAQATSADSVQMRYDIQCINFFAVDHVNCQPVQYGIIYDDLYLRVLTGTPQPVFDVFPGQIAASTFVDGTDPLSVGCNAGTIAAGHCWPGVRGSDTPDIGGDHPQVHNNFNNPYGDTLTLNLLTGVRKFGMGINWKYGYDKGTLAGEMISKFNATSYNSTKDTPRWIFRIFDPALKVWSPWDSSALFANSAQISPKPGGGADTILIDSEFRFDWPPADKYYVNSGDPLDLGPNVDAAFVGGFTLNGNTKFSQVPFLPRGTRIQYYFKAVDINGGTSLDFGTDRFANETEDLPTLPGSSIKAPDIIEFNVLPRVYPAGAAGSLVGSRTDTKVLNLDSRYSSWPDGYDPITQALRAMGVRADRYRHTQGNRNASGIGGHEMPGRRVERLSDYFPNAAEYGIKDLLAAHYNIFIDNPHTSNDNVYDEEDADLIRQWWITDTGINGGDRCTFAAGDNMWTWLLIGSKSYPQSANQISLAQNVYGVANVIDAWTGTNTTPYPTIDDRFAGGGPGLASPGTYTYPVDGGCPAPQRFDGLTKIGSSDAANAVFYPGGVTEVAGIARSSELDAGGSTDNDRNKALCYGFSMNYVRTAGIPTTAANYVHSGVENRMKILYKFLASCRQTSVSTTPCWPCPSNPAEISSNWATAAGFQTGTYGNLFPIQDFTQATGVVVSEAPKVNRLEGNFPNPFNPETAIRFQAATPGKVTIRVFDVAGRLVNTLTKNVTETGLNEIRWNGKSTDGRTMASGMYFYRIRFANGQQSEAKMTMLK